MLLQDTTVFVLRLAKLDVEAIDIELLMYYILRVRHTELVHA